MADYSGYHITAVSSALLRILSYIFLRWIPGNPLPPAINTLAVIYVTSFTLDLFRSRRQAVVGSSVVQSSRPDQTAASTSSFGIRPGERGTEGRHAQGRSATRRATGPTKTVSNRFLKDLLNGTPGLYSAIWTILILSVNILILVMTLDLTYSSSVFFPATDLSFARVGFVSDTAARILIREPDSSNLPLILSYRNMEDGTVDNMKTNMDSGWQFLPPLLYLSKQQDYTAPFVLKDLVPDTRYEFALSNGKGGFLITGPSPGKMSVRASRAGGFRFMHSSCIFPRFPYDIWSHPLAIPGFRSLGKALNTFKPVFILFLGDFIYADLPKNWGRDLDSFHQLYRHVYASPDYERAAVTAETMSTGGRPYNIPWIHTWDDHELRDNWEWNSTGIFSSAFGAYADYHLSVNSPKTSQSTYFSFTQGPATFFILDTRTYRSRLSQTMLGRQQLDAVLSWIHAPTSSGVYWKILVSSVPFTKNWHVHNFDTWGGFLEERRVLLEAMWTSMHCKTNTLREAVCEGHRFVVLSGDRHEFAATSFSAPLALDMPGATVFEFSASPLSMFYLPIRTYWKTDPAFEGDATDTVIKYIPDGNSKIGAIQIEGPTADGPSTFRYKLFIDGEEAWTHTLPTPSKSGSHNDASNL